jgi:hypothetical protein
VTGHDLGLVGKREQPRVNRFEYLFGVASGKIGAADAAGKKRVSSDDHLERNEVKTDRALRVAGGVDNLGRNAIEADTFGVGEGLIGRSGGGDGHADPAGLLRHHLEQGEIVLIEENGSTREALELERATDVVNVGVRDQDLSEREAVFGQAAVNALNFVTGINDDGFARGFVAEQSAVALQRADGKGLEDHQIILGGGAARRDGFCPEAHPAEKSRRHAGISREMSGKFPDAEKGQGYEIRKEQRSHGRGTEDGLFEE